MSEYILFIHFIGCKHVSQAAVTHDPQRNASYRQNTFVTCVFRQ